MKNFLLGFFSRFRKPAQQGYIDLRVTQLTHIAKGEAFAYTIHFSNQTKLRVEIPKELVLEIADGNLTLKDSLGGEFSEVGPVLGRCFFEKITFSATQYSWGLGWGCEYKHDSIWTTQHGIGGSLQAYIKGLMASLYGNECEVRGSRDGEPYPRKKWALR